MGKILDFLLTENWEEYKRVQLYKKIGKKLESEKPKERGCCIVYDKSCKCCYPKQAKNKTEKEKR